jgi:hypothetical protein
MALKVSVDRTALYPGDRLNYLIRVEHSSSIEFVQDHVRKDQLSLEPFEVLGVSTAAGDLPNGRKFFDVKLLLTTYDAGHPDVAVPSFNLFYFKREQGTNKDTTAAETLAVPPFKIGLRSTLTDPPGNIRDSKPVLPVSQIEWILPGILGVGGLVAVLIYASWVGLAWARSGFWRHKTSESVRKKSTRDSFDEIRQAPLDTLENVDSFYARASAILRGLAAKQLGDCRGMTAREMQAALEKSGRGEDHAMALGDLMEECDLVRYSPHGAERARDRHSEFLRKFEAIVERR